MSDEFAERYSLCLVHVDESGINPYFKYYRIADFFPEDNDEELLPAIVQAHTASLEDAQANPDHLYNPSAAYRHNDRESDFYLFQWRPDPADLGRQLTRSCRDEAGRPFFKEAREVFVLEGSAGVVDLQKSLSEGIPFGGRTTTVFYIAYEAQDDALLAMRCQKKDFLFDDGTIRLPSDIANVRQTLLSAPRVILNVADIIESPFPETGCRKVYARLGELEPFGYVLLRSIDYYIADYVKWFAQKSSRDIGQAEKRDLTRLLDEALTRPEALEEYLGAGPSKEELVELRTAIAKVVSDEEDSVRGVFRDALLEDESFRLQCVDQVRKEYDERLDVKRSEIDAADKKLSGLRQDAEEKLRSLQEIEGEIENGNGLLEKLRNEIADLEQGKDAILEELQSNIALKLGLRAAGSVSGSVVPAATGLFATEGSPIDCEEVDKSLREVLVANMEQLGLMSVSGQSDQERRKASLGVVAALSATKILALPQPVAAAIADSLSIALFGRTAARICVPADCRDIKGLTGSLEESGVYLVENVIDSVNEGMLSAVLYGDVSPIVVFPFMSHGSARLASPEVWERMFMPSVESLVLYPSSRRRGSLKKIGKVPEFPQVSAGIVLEEANSLKDELSGVQMTDGQLLLIATVLEAAEKLADEAGSFEVDSAECLVAQHIAMSSAFDAGMVHELLLWAGEDAGLKCLSSKLGLDEK